MKDPIFKIHIGNSSVESSVYVNDQDISKYVRKIEVSLEAGELPKLELTLSYQGFEANVNAAIADILLVPTPVIGSK